MTSRNRATVEELIRLMNTRDRRPMHLFHPDIEWHWAASAPGRTVYRGHEELATGSGVYLEAPVAHLHEFTDDGLVKRWWMFGDADKARRRFVAGDRPA